MMKPQEKRQERVSYSLERLATLKNAFSALSATKKFPKLTVFAAGSYARQEAGKFSDIDLFFLTSLNRSEMSNRNTNSLRLFGQIIEAVENLGFKEFSNDGEYLVILHTDDILVNLGGRTDDHQNYFTARMLLLLEGHCLFGEDVFAEVTKQIVDSYFFDFPDHKDNFHPRFLLNDICRFWKTLLLNYENKRRFKIGSSPSESNQKEKNSDQEDLKIKQKVRNFKLKYSRMTTCFATIAALASDTGSINSESVLALTKKTPYERLEMIPERIPATATIIEQLLDSYSWFLNQTALKTKTLESRFSDEAKREAMFKKAKTYGDLMFELLSIIDQERPELKLFRNLVI